MKKIVLFAIVLSFLFTNVQAEIIDNNDAKFIKEGTWYSANNSFGFHGNNYYYSPQNSNGTAQWNFVIEKPGKYILSAQWAVNNNHSEDVVYTITNGENKYTTVPVSQKINGNQFNVLGIYDLTIGTVSVSINWNTGYAVADAMKLELVEEADTDTKKYTLTFECETSKDDIDGIKIFQVIGNEYILKAVVPLVDIMITDIMVFSIPEDMYIVGNKYTFVASFYKGDKESDYSNAVDFIVPEIQINPPVLKLKEAILYQE